MSSTQSQEIEKLTKEIADLKIRIKRIEDYLLNTFALTDPREYIHHEEDEVYKKAVELVIQFNTASPSFIQRKLNVGYARAARLLDKMEENGIVGEAQGAKPRDVLIKAPQKKVKTKK